MKDFYSDRQDHLLLAVAVLVFAFFGQQTVLGQDKYKAGDRVECEVTGNLPGRWWEKGTVMDFRPNDQPDGSWYRVKVDSNKVEYYCKLEHIRAAAGGGPTKANPNTKPQTTTQNTNQDTDAPPAGDFLECPIKQKQARNGSRPDAELLKKLIRCAKGEKGVEEGDEGAVKVDISGLSIGAARPWTYAQDLGNGKRGTLVYPVKATYTVTTFYRTATEVAEGWIRILNFYVNAFGEWAIGSEENVKSSKSQRIQK